MPKPWHEKHVVAFEVAGEFGDIYHRGEIDLTLYGESLEEKIRKTLKRIGQPFIAYQQSMLYARPTALWRIDPVHGHRISVEIPEALLKEEQARVQDRRRRDSMFSGDDSPH